ncbi:MAG: tRNA pseudouridine(54/55) synthase Pus10 [Candidatus Hodarchaeota archaeon]
MIIFHKVLEIYSKYYICLHCVGRMFSLLGTGTTNKKRGYSLLLSLTMENHHNYLSNNKDQQAEALKHLKILAENAHFLPAQRVLENEGLEYSEENQHQICYLCSDIFSNIDNYVNEVKSKLERIEFNNFLVGSSPDSQIINNEDKFKTEFKLLEAEAFKSHFNRVIGKKLMVMLKKPPEFSNPDILITYSLSFYSFKIDLIIKSLFIYGRYNKLMRGIPQTHWFCKKCQGKGCKQCNFTGKQYLTSIEELISPEFVKESEASDSKFHGAGREDIDVRMLGIGRPFVLELRNPKVRNLNLVYIEKRINKSLKKKIKVSNLKYSDKKEVIKLKAESKNTKKIYKVIAQAQNKISKELFDEKLRELKTIFENQKINQRTPIRVSHRRVDKIREKIIFKLGGKYLKSNLFEFTIESQGGTYIKELINGDEGRTTPSFSEVFGFPLVCKALDVLNISL